VPFRKATKAASADSARDPRRVDQLGRQISTEATLTPPLVQVEQRPVRALHLDAIAVPPKRMRRLRPEKVDELAESIATPRGLVNPITVQPKGDRYILIAGHHRLAAVQKLGLATISATVREGLDADQAQLIEIDENLIRADLSPAEPALHLAERKRIYERLHPETKLGASGKGRAKVRQNGEANDRFTKDSADKTGKSERTVQREIARAANIPDLADLVGTSLDSADELDAVAKLPLDEPRRLIDRAKAGESVTARQADILAAAKEIYARQAAIRSENKARLKQSRPAIPTGKFGTIVIDPPLQVEEMGLTSRPDLSHIDWPSMNESELAAFPVLDLAADDCHLFCWTTSKHIFVARRLIEQWGFTYSFLMTWHKPSGYQPPGMPQFNSEFVIYARKGSPEFTTTKDFRTCFEGRRREHCRKPAEFYDTVRRVTAGPRIDIFSREHHDGFKPWGNETTKFKEAAEVVSQDEVPNTPPPAAPSGPDDDLTIPKFLLRTPKPEASRA
jgi:ParB/RepB/Spo0J family partition protein